MPCVIMMIVIVNISTIYHSTNSTYTLILLSVDNLLTQAQVVYETHNNDRTRR